MDLPGEREREAWTAGMDRLAAGNVYIRDVGIIPCAALPRGARAAPEAPSVDVPRIGGRASERS